MSKRKKSRLTDRHAMVVDGPNEKLHRQLEKTVRSGRTEEAIGILQQLIALSPDRFDYYNLLGDLCLKIRKFGEAIEAFSKALQIEVRNPDVYIGLGLALHEFRRFDGAAASFEIALVYDPSNHRALGYWALSLVELGLFERAVELFSKAIAIEPNDAIHYLNRAHLLTRMTRHEDALHDYERAVAIKPEDALVRLGHASHWYRLRNYDSALAAVDYLVAAGRADPVALNFKGVVLGELGRFEESRDAYTEALRINPDYADAKFNKSLNCLLTGDFETGWQLYESRFKKSNANSPRHFEGTRWYGHQSLTDKTIFVHCEQGLGDCLQFSRYILNLSSVSQKVIFEVHSQLKGLFNDLPANVELIEMGKDIPHYDYYSPLMSLPMAFGSRVETISSEMIKLTPTKDKEFPPLEGLLQEDGLKVGVVWSGNAAHSNDHNRSISFEQFRLAIDDLDAVVCLQKEIREPDREALASHGGVLVVSDLLSDMSDTAALIAKLDVIITVDTSVAHLAASLGKPTWILISSTPDFRWLLGRKDSPWYPTVQLFRKRCSEDWTEPLLEVRKRIADLRTAGFRRTCDSEAPGDVVSTGMAASIES